MKHLPSSTHTLLISSFSSIQQPKHSEWNKLLSSVITIRLSPHTFGEQEVYSPCPLQESVISGKIKKSDRHAANGGPSLLLMALAFPDTAPTTPELEPSALSHSKPLKELLRWLNG